MAREIEEINFGIEFLSKIIKWIEDNLDPEDVFDDGVLGEWALNNDFRKQEIEYIIGRR